MPFFHGSLKAKEATKLLYAEPAGTFLLRTNEENEYRITFKRAHKVEHLRIFSEDSMHYIGGSDDNPFSSLRRLIDHLKEDKNMFSIPLKSAIYAKRALAPMQATYGSSLRVNQVPASLYESDEEPSEYDDRIANSLRQICRSVSESDKITNSDEEEEYENTAYDTQEEHENVETYPSIGMMSKVEASALLADQPVGSWILRENESGEKRISKKSSRKTAHIQLIEEDGMFYLTSCRLKTTLEVLIQREQRQGRLGDQITQRH